MEITLKMNWIESLSKNIFLSEIRGFSQRFFLVRFISPLTARMFTILVYQIPGYPPQDQGHKKVKFSR